MNVKAKTITPVERAIKVELQMSETEAVVMAAFLGELTGGLQRETVAKNYLFRKNGLSPKIARIAETITLPLFDALNEIIRTEGLKANED
jgi:hypothetical protein